MDKIFELIEKENTRQREGIQLSPSENFASDEVLQAVEVVCPINMPRGIQEDDIIREMK